MKLSVYEGDYAFLKQLQAGWRGVVHSCFRNVINISPEFEGPLYTLMVKNLEAAPGGIRLNTESFEPIVQGTPAMSSSGILKVGTWNIDFRHAKTYRLSSRTFYWNRLSSDRIAALMYRIRSKPYITENTDYSRAVAQLLDERLATVRVALGETPDNFLSVAKQLLGFGYGLTPTGDDYLTGLLLVVTLPGSPLSKFRSVIPELLALAKVKTNEISQTELYHAARGTGRKVLLDFIEMCMYGGNELEALNRLLSVGQTSGRDLALGVLTGFEVIDEMEEKTWQ